LNAIKLFFAKRILRNRQSFKVLNPSVSAGNRMGILISAKEVASVEQVILYLKLIFPEFSVQTLVYSEDKLNIDEDELQLFSLKDLNLFAEFNSVALKEFTNIDFDILINYHKITSLPLALVSHQSKAKIQVGFPSHYNKDMILTIDTQTDLPEIFFKTLHQYLTISKLI